MILSDHARERMQKKGITQDEIAACIEHGTKELEGFIHGEYRYGRRLELKDKTIFVIYTYVGDKKRIITCFNEEKKQRQKMKENQWYCASCHEEMKDVVLSSYTFEEGLPLQNVDAIQCPACNKVSFTEEQADRMEERTERIKKDSFGFERRITISGKSLVVTIPSELADHLHIKKGQKVKIFPVAKEGILIRKVST